MTTGPIQTSAEELENWDRVAAHPNCIERRYFSRKDILAMLWRIRRAEAALTEIAKSRVLGHPDETSRAQINAIIEIAKAGLPGEMECAAQIKSGYTGPIEVGMRFVWEPELPPARCLIEVAKVVPVLGGDSKIFTFVPGSVVDPVWNEESRFREAVIPVKGQING